MLYSNGLKIYLKYINIHMLYELKGEIRSE